MTAQSTRHAREARLPSSDPSPPEGPARHRSLRFARVRDLVITVIGIVGIVTIAWLVAAWVFGLSVIAFTTGSMAPTMPQGSAAIVQSVSADTLRVGDVVTVGRSDGQLVTHRIIGIDAHEGRPQARVLTLRGDDNDRPDADRYVVSEAPRVLVAAPLVGNLILWARTPVPMVTGSVLLAVVIGWGLWPSGERRTPEAAGPRGEERA